MKLSTKQLKALFYFLLCFLYIFFYIVFDMPH